MSLRAVLATVAVAAFASAGAPNIVLMLADDLGYGDLSAFGAPQRATPHLDALALGSRAFHSFYAAACVCTPSRAGLLTGRLAARSSMHLVLMQADTRGLPPAELTLAEMLGRSGYDTAFTGKWHLGWNPAHRPVRQGFDEASDPSALIMDQVLAYESALVE